MKSLVRVPLKNGVIAGVMGAIFLIALYYMGRHPLLIPIFADFRIILLGVFSFFTLKEIRDHYQDGTLLFWQGVIGSLLLMLSFVAVSSLLMAMFMWAIPEFMNDYVSLYTKHLKSLSPEDVQRSGEDIYNRTLSRLPSTKASELLFPYFLSSLGITLFISIILSVFLRRQPKNQTLN